MLPQRAGQFPSFSIDDLAQHQKAKAVGGLPEWDGSGAHRNQQQIAARLMQCQQVIFGKLIALDAFDGDLPAVDADAAWPERDHSQSMVQLHALAELLVLP